MVGVMGSSNSAIADYTTISWPTGTASSDSNNVLLKVYYTKIGAEASPQYYVLRVMAELISNTAKEKVLFVEYQEVTGSPQMYIPPPPKVDAYLANDFLYPFYVAQ